MRKSGEAYVLYVGPSIRPPVGLDETSRETVDVPVDGEQVACTRDGGRRSIKNYENRRRV